MSGMSVNQTTGRDAVSDATGSSQTPDKDALKQAFEEALAKFAVSAIPMASNNINDALKDMET